MLPTGAVPGEKILRSAQDDSHWYWSGPVIPGEFLIDDGEHVLNVGRKTVVLSIANTGDRPIQVGSHYHFFETNPALRFDRAAARGFRLNIAAGTAVRFEPGQERSVELVALAGGRIVYGFNALVSGPLDKKVHRSPDAVRGESARTSKAPGLRPGYEKQKRKPSTK